MKWEGFLVPLALVWLAGANGVFLRPWAAVTTAGVLGFLAWRRLTRGVRVGSPWLCLAGLCAWVGVSALLQPVEWTRAAQLAAMGVAALMLALVAAHPAGRAGLRGGVVVAGVGAAVWLVVERLAVPGRPAGPFANPNLAASLSVLALALLGFHRARWSGGLVPVLLAGVAASASRAALVAVLVLAVAWLVLAAGARGRYLAGVLILGGIAVLAWRFAHDQDPLRFERWRIWQVAWNTAWAYFPWGAGPGGFGEAVLPHNFPREGEFARFARVPDLAENDGLQLAASLGLLGLALGIGLVASTLHQWWAKGWQALAPSAVILTTSAFHSQLLWPSLAFAAISAGRFSGRCRLKLPPLPALLVVWPLALWIAVALPWPDSGLGEVAGKAFGEVRATLIRAEGPEDLRRALVAAEGLVRRQPRSGEAWRLLGLVQLRVAQASGEGSSAGAAVKAFRQAQAANPKDVWGYLGEGEAWLALGQWERAQAAAGKALRVEPNCVRCWLVLADAQLAAGATEQARGALRQALLGQRRSRGYPFVSRYERALASTDPVLQERLMRVLGERP